MLSVKYGAEVPRAMAEMAEHHARAAGLPLDALEAIGASLDFVEAFIVASEDGKGGEFVAQMGWPSPQGSVARTDVVRARQVAARLFGVDFSNGAST